MGGFLEVGIDPENHQVVINHPDLHPDENGVGHIKFSPGQAINLARLLLTKAAEAQLNPSQTFPGREIGGIEVQFAIPVLITPAMELELNGLVNQMARATETEEIVHWPAGQGSKPSWNEPNEPEWDNSIYFIETFARERYPSEPFDPKQ